MWTRARVLGLRRAREHRALDAVLGRVVRADPRLHDVVAMSSKARERHFVVGHGPLAPYGLFGAGRGLKAARGVERDLRAGARLPRRRAFGARRRGGVGKGSLRFDYGAGGLPASRRERAAASATASGRPTSITHYSGLAPPVVPGQAPDLASTPARVVIVLRFRKRPRDAATNLFERRTSAPLQRPQRAATGPRGRLPHEMWRCGRCLVCLFA